MRSAPLPITPGGSVALRATWHTMLRELRIAALGGRGRLTAAAIVICGVIAGGLRVLSYRGASPAAVEAAGRQQLASLAKIYGLEAANGLSAEVPALVSLCLFFMLALPIIVVLAGHDLVARDLRDGVMRLVRPRVSVAAIVLGKVLGLWAAIAAAALVAYLAVASLAMGAGGAVVSSALASALRLWLVCALAALPYAALVVALSAASLSPSRTLLVGLGIVAVLTMVRAKQHGAAEIGRWLIPSTNEAALFARDAAAGAVGRLALWTACWLVIAGLVLRRRRI